MRRNAKMSKMRYLFLLLLVLGAPAFGQHDLRMRSSEPPPAVEPRIEGPLPRSSNAEFERSVGILCSEPYRESCVKLQRISMDQLAEEWARPQTSRIVQNHIAATIEVGTVLGITDWSVVQGYLEAWKANAEYKFWKKRQEAKPK